jgi:hypothetical protein
MSNIFKKSDLVEGMFSSKKKVTDDSDSGYGYKRNSKKPKNSIEFEKNMKGATDYSFKQGRDTEDETIDELVDSKGGKLQGDEHIDQVGKATSSKDTTDDHVRKSRQGTPFYRRYYSEDDESLEVDSLEEVAKDKMKGVLEDILSKRKFDKDVIDKVKYSNGIPDVEVLKESLPVLIRKIAHIKTLLDREEVGGDEKAILLNSLLSIDLTDIPSQYKRELARKLGY